MSPFNEFSNSNNIYVHIASNFDQDIGKWIKFFGPNAGPADRCIETSTKVFPIFFAPWRRVICYRMNLAAISTQGAGCSLRCEAINHRALHFREQRGRSSFGVCGRATIEFRQEGPNYPQNNRRSQALEWTRNWREGPLPQLHI